MMQENGPKLASIGTKMQESACLSVSLSARRLWADNDDDVKRGRADINAGAKNEHPSFLFV